MAAPVITALTSGNTAVGATTFATASVTPALNSLILCCIHHRSATTPVDTIAAITAPGLSTVYSHSTQIHDMSVQGVPAARLEIYKGIGNGVAGTITFVFTNSQSSAAWAIIQATGIDTSSFLGNTSITSSIRQTAQVINLGTFTTSQSATARLLNQRGDNATFLAVTHEVNEGTAAGTGMTELTDQSNAGIANLATYIGTGNTFVQRPSATWATATRDYAAIALEIASPGNQGLVADPIADLYAT